MSDPNARYEAEHRRFNDLAVVGSAEGVVTRARMAELAAAQQSAYRRVSAAQSRLTRAQREGDAAKITAARQRVTQAHAEFDRISDAVITEMFALQRARLDHTGALLDQMRRTWDAGDEIREALTTGNPEPPPEPSPSSTRPRSPVLADHREEVIAVDRRQQVPCGMCGGTGRSRLTGNACDRCRGSGVDPFATGSAGR
ncbi:hypothetical protein JQS43_24320 [Natronosporangium hydrolyticum]|uniref:Uncharacterized protein n=1 Tax=Natronosporangium hydrolyticum TaxID=2811111 RepID=A0A895YAX8_9ACTN|nr:hypothetical protein [Natronosporangium hydrolyticum]QSB14561.1 hypothetical protein JQS43_24320 [Natronosporangium hydrolyticum]